MKVRFELDESACNDRRENAHQKRGGSGDGGVEAMRSSPRMRRVFGA